MTRFMKSNILDLEDSLLPLLSLGVVFGRLECYSASVRVFAAYAWGRHDVF